MDLSALKAFCAAKGRPLDESQITLFERFAEALYRWNTQINLTRVPESDCAVRHFVDSLLVAEWIEEGARVLDIGCGPGFPAWPLACWRLDLSVTALDGSAKPLVVMREVSMPKLTVLQGRAEDVSQRETFDLVTGRAFAPLAIQLEASAAWCKVGGTVVPFRTPQELAAAQGLDVAGLGLALESCELRPLPDGGPERLFPIFRKVSKTPRAYPRDWASMKKRPLDAMEWSSSRASGAAGAPNPGAD